MGGWMTTGGGMTDAPARASSVQLACVVATSVLIGLAITLAAPFRVADCGPADPDLLRYLGGPFLYRTGTGIPSSMEAQIWAGPFFANVAVFAVLVFGLQQVGARAAPRPFVLWLGLGLSLAMILVLASSVLNVDDMQWTPTGPPITAEACDIRFEFRPDQRAWQAAP